MTHYDWHKIIKKTKQSRQHFKVTYQKKSGTEACMYFNTESTGLRTLPGWAVTSKFDWKWLGSEGSWQCRKGCWVTCTLSSRIRFHSCASKLRLFGHTWHFLNDTSELIELLQELFSEDGQPSRGRLTASVLKTLGFSFSKISLASSNSENNSPKESCTQSLKNVVLVVTGRQWQYFTEICKQTHFDSEMLWS